MFVVVQMSGMLDVIQLRVWYVGCSAIERLCMLDVVQYRA